MENLRGVNNLTVSYIGKTSISEIIIITTFRRLKAHTFEKLPKYQFVTKNNQVIPMFSSGFAKELL